MDTNFGTNNGYSIIYFGGSPPSELARTLAVDNQDNIYIAGKFATGFNTEDAFFVLKMNNLGSG